MNKLPKGWEWRNLGGKNGLKAACEFLDRFRVPVNEDERAKRQGPYPYYGANGQQGWINSFLFDEELVLLAEDGGFFFDLTKPASYRVSGKCWVNNHAHVLRPAPDIDPDWLNFCLAYADFTTFIPEPVRPKLNQENAKKIRIPIPPLEEQRRIVSRIEELTSRADEARQLILEKEAELDTLIRATYQRMIKGAEWKPLKQLASLVRRKINTKRDEEYEEMGIRSFGRGTFKKPVLTGEQVGDKRIYRIHEGDLVFNNVFAWEGAIAVTQPEDHGRVGSHRFITYSPHKGKATAEFLCHHFLSEQGLEAIGAASPGSAGRNRTLGLAKLDSIKVPVPNFQEQERFETLAKHRRQIQRESTAIDSELKTLQSAIIAKAFRGEL